MRNWHPLSKLAIGLGVLGLGVVWWTDQGGMGEASAVAGRIAQAEAVAAPSVGAAPRVGEATSALPAGAPLVGRVLPSAATLEAMVERPLFAPDRRPFEPGAEVMALPLEARTAEPEPASGPAHPAVRFIGSIEEEARLRALVSDGFNVRAIGEGEEIDGWVVVGIESRRLTLGLDDERLELTIFE